MAPPIDVRGSQSSCVILLARIYRGGTVFREIVIVPNSRNLANLPKTKNQDGGWTAPKSNVYLCGVGGGQAIANGQRIDYRVCRDLSRTVGCKRKAMI